VNRFLPALRDSFPWQSLLDTENYFSRETPGQGFQESFLMRAGNRLPENDACYPFLVLVHNCDQ